MRIDWDGQSINGTERMEIQTSMRNLMILNMRTNKRWIIGSNGAQSSRTDVRYMRNISRMFYGIQRTKGKSNLFGRHSKHVTALPPFGVHWTPAVRKKPSPFGLSLSLVLCNCMTQFPLQNILYGTRQNKPWFYASAHSNFKKHNCKADNETIKASKQSSTDSMAKCFSLNLHSAFLYCPSST